MESVIRIGRSAAMLGLLAAPFVVLGAVASPGFGKLFVLAFFGGVILNAMPCVLPVLTLKAFHVVDTLRARPERARVHGIAYAAGTTLVFSIFALVIILLREGAVTLEGASNLQGGGQTLGWGMQMQFPEVGIAVVTVLYLFGLNALGLFEITIGLSTNTAREGLIGSVANGMLAAIMSMPCTAPMIGTAAAFAVGSNATRADTLGLFAGIGLGLAAPFTVLSFVPRLIRTLPRPGAWMESFKQLMGFTLIGAAVFFFAPLQKQLTPASANGVLFFLFWLTIALWAIQKYGNIMHGARRRWLVRGTALALVLGFWAQFVTLERPPPSGAAADCAPTDPNAERPPHPPVKDGHINWAAFSPAEVEAAARRGQAILLDFTADWCVACKALEATVMNTRAVHEKLEAYDVLPMQGDFTNLDPVMETWINAADRTGIPLVMVIAPSGKKHVMPQIFTIGELVDALDAHASGRS